MAEMSSESCVTIEVNFNNPQSSLPPRSDVGSKSPGKTKKKLIKGSLFRRTSSQDSPSQSRFERSSSRKKKNSRDSKSGTSSRESLDLLDNDTPPNVSEGQKKEKNYVGSQEIEEKSVTELSAKKVQKLNQELLKTNSQLTKSVDSLKKEKAELVSHNQRLNTEKKTLVKELRRVSSKGEVKNLKTSLLDTEPEDQEEKVHQLETVLSTRDKKLQALRTRLERFQSEMSDSQYWDEPADPSTNVALAKLEEEKGISTKMREENEVLRAKIASLETQLDHMQKEQTDFNPHNSSSSFKRGYRQTSSMFAKSSDEIHQERESHSRSPEPNQKSSSHSRSHSHSNIEFNQHTGSSPNLSPYTKRRRSTNPDLKTLQSCLKIAIDEKKTFEEKSQQLEEEVKELKKKVKELEHALAEAEKKATEKKTVPPPTSPESEQLKKKLRMAVSEKTSLTSQCDKLRKELEEVKAKNKTLEKEKNVVSVKKDSTIRELEEERDRLKKDLTKAKEQITEMKNAANKSPPMQRATLSNKISHDRTQNIKPNSAVKADETKKAPEVPKETTRQESKSPVATSNAKVNSSVLGSPSRGAKISAARAMFEEKDSTAETGPSSPKVYQKMKPAQRRSSLQMSIGLADIKENTTVHHVKSNSTDSTLSGSEPSPPSASTPTGTKVSKIKVTSSVSPTTSPVLNVRKEIKEISVRSPKTERREQNSTVFSSSKTTSTTSSTVVSPQSPSVPRTGGITINSTSTSSNGSRTPGSIKKGIESARAQFESKAATSSPNQARVMWPSTYYGSKPKINEPPKPAATVQPPAQPKEEKIVRYNSLNVPTPFSNPIKKAASMQSIPETITDSSSSSTSNTSTSTIVEAENAQTSRSPVARRIQRRDRKDRPKTMYATRSETVSLVKLISRFQEEEREKQEKEMKKFGETNRLGGGTSSPKRAPSPVQLRSHAPGPRTPRPNTYYGGTSNRNFDLQPPGFTSRQTSYSYEKPRPEERRLVRANTVATGLGTANKQSKKASLLRWCQFVTREYDNVYIENFGQSFASGLAFCAILHHFIPDKIPYNTLQHENREQNFRTAFESAESEGIPSLLDVEDMVALPIPDWMSVMTYISFIYNKFGKPSSNGVH